jgi:D-glycero-D-manno-heptose 1,7-bisphosphate phosphatase
MSQRALFLDRDGVINHDTGYVHRAEDFSFLPGIFELVRYAGQELGWAVVVVTNQSGIGRGYFDEAAFSYLTEWMLARFAAEQAPVTRVYHCAHHPTHGIGSYRAAHPWRKPEPGMLLQAASDLDLDLAGSAMIGDKLDDMVAARAAGVGLRICLDPARSLPAIGEPPYLVVRDLAEALALLRREAVPKHTRTD